MSQEISQILQTLERVLELNVHQSGEEVLENFVQKKPKALIPGSAFDKNVIFRCQDSQLSWLHFLSF